MNGESGDPFSREILARDFIRKKPGVSKAALSFFSRALITRRYIHRTAIASCNCTMRFFMASIDCARKNDILEERIISISGHP